LLGGALENRVMTGSAITAAPNSPSLQVSPSSGHHRHHGQHSSAISDVDAPGSSLAAPAHLSGKIGGKADIAA